MVPKVGERLDTMFPSEKVATFLPGGKNDKKMKIRSWAQLRQFCATSEQLEYISSYDEREVISTAVEQATQRIGSQVDTEFSRLWNLDQALDIVKRYPRVLDQTKFIALISKCASEGRYTRLRNLAEGWRISEATGNIEKAISSAEEKGTKRAWLNAFATAAESGNIQQLEHTLSNLLYSYGFQRDTPRFHRPAVFRTAAQLFESSENTLFARKASFWEAYHRGRYAIDRNRVDKAVNSLSQAHLRSLEQVQETGNLKGIKLGETWRWLAEAEKEQLQSQGQYKNAREYLEETVDLIESFEDFEDNEAREECKKRIEALQMEALGDELLNSGNYNEAKKQYGTAIGVLERANTDYDGAIQYLKNRRLAIQGSLLEAEGEYEDAINKYADVENVSDYVPPFVQRQKARKYVCLAKQAVLSRRPDEARSHLQEIDYDGALVSSEIEQIEQIAELLEDYQHGRLTEIDEIISALNRGVVSQGESNNTDFGYEQDYRVAYMFLTTAQPFREGVGADESIDGFVEFALKNVLQPASVDDLLDSDAIGATERDERWKNEIPDFVTRQIQDASRDAARKPTSANYANILETLTGHLEEAIEVFVAFHARRQYGEGWKERLASGTGVSLTDLSEYLNRDVFQSGEVATEVRSLISEQKFENIVLDDKDGTIVDVRNDLAHNNVSRVSREEYNQVLNTIESILSAIATEMPVLGMIRGENRYNDYSVRLLTTHHNNIIEIRTEGNLTEGEVYFLPRESLFDQMVCDINERNIVKLDADDIRESIRSHSRVDIE